MSEPIVIPCPKCTYPLKVREEYLGKRATCRHCQTEIVLERPLSTGVEPSKTETARDQAHGETTPTGPSQSELTLQAEINRLTSESASARQELETLKAKYEKVKAQLATARSTADRLANAESELTSARAELLTATNLVERLKGDLEAESIRSESLRSELQKTFEAEHKNALDLVETHQQEAEIWKARHLDLQTQHAELRHELDHKLQAVNFELENARSEHETLLAGHQAEHSAKVKELEEALAHSEERLKTRDALALDVAEMQRRLDETTRALQAAESEREKLRESLHGLETKSSEANAEKERSFAETIRSLEFRVEALTGELQASRTHQKSLEDEIAVRSADAERDKVLLAQSREFKEQIRTFLAGLGINLPGA